METVCRTGCCGCSCCGVNCSVGGTEDDVIPDGFGCECGCGSGCSCGCCSFMLIRLNLFALAERIVTMSTIVDESRP
ncbi:hypothetical protein BMYO_1071 [Bifidobacterium myosotis]|uniref:Uncharacterized protein n=1 Tax=Bifidobacterium myosotis TaxID=1630166 RepID=A0A261FKZ9_9BIFI|nr:hypothetical protein BMYO_1071 [Bifidobacterium myosotis]